MDPLRHKQLIVSFIDSSSCPEVPLKMFAKLTESHLCLSLFNKVVGLIPAALLKINSNTGIFLLILQHFMNTFFNRALPVTAYS